MCPAAHNTKPPAASTSVNGQNTSKAARAIASPMPPSSNQIMQVLSRRGDSGPVGRIVIDVDVLVREEPEPARSYELLSQSHAPPVIHFRPHHLAFGRGRNRAPVEIVRHGFSVP